MTDHYVLIGQTPVPEPDLLTWARWMEGNRRVAFTRLPWCHVSTVFLGLDHSFRPGAEPVLFESMTFWPADGGYEQERCSTWLEAEAMHKHMVAEASQPAVIMRSLWRLLWNRLEAAADDWRRAWREQRGIPLSEWEAGLDRIRKLSPEV